MNINELRKSRNLDFGKITGALQKQTPSYGDDKGDYFTLTKDKSGNSSAVLRFLPTAKGDELPWVEMYSHAFTGPSGKWYIENCRSTIKEDDPVNDANRILWKSGSEKDKEQARKQKRKLNYIAQVYVVSDPGNRENEGKVMKYKFGKKIFEKIQDKLTPTFDDEKPLNVFDLWEGANFKLKMQQVEGYPNYDKSSFGDVSAIAETDEEILEIVNKQMGLAELVAPDKFKSFEDLKKKFESVMSTGNEVAARARIMENEPVAQPKAAPKAAPAPTPKAVAKDDEDLEDFFKSIGGD